MDYKYLAELLFPHVTLTPEDMEKKYPPRNLPEGAVVSRHAPSPTGYVHLGNIVQSLTSERVCHQSGGVMYLRIEDTDTKREVKGAVGILIDSLAHYKIKFDEGATADGDVGAYGPYRQRQRRDIYHVYAKYLVQNGMAYPCFCTAEELAAIRERQKAEKANLGYWGPWAIWRDRPVEDIGKALKEGKPWVLRFRSTGSIKNKYKFHDLIKGEIDITENEIDIVLLKSDGIPTYHFAHVVDDHLMRTTHVIRGDEWLASLPVHIQLFKALGFKLPKYAHIGPIMIMDGSSKRKISKRKDPQFGLIYYKKCGYPVESVYEYVLTILNSNFEDWRCANPDAPAEEFRFSLRKMNPAGALFDAAKLADISKNVVSKMTADKIYADLLEWAKEFEPEFAKALEAGPDYAKAIISIGRGGKKPRKDYGTWSELREYMRLFYDDTFTIVDEYPEEADKSDIKATLTRFLETYSPADDQNVWFNKIKAIAASLRYAPEMKDYKQNPGAYRGSVADVSMFLRVAVTGKLSSPDMYTVMQILGEARVRQRVEAMLSRLG
ncbi:MAG: glutamate--tRNA ligase [Eubacteriales bacterium]|jgi:glutamyl-tRNA synthetase